MDPLEYMKNHGFFFASNDEQEKFAIDMVSKGKWRHLTDINTSLKDGRHFYVMSSVENIHHLPYSLYKLFAISIENKVNNFKKGDVCCTNLKTSDGQEIKAIIKLGAEGRRFEATILAVDSSHIFYVEAKDLFKLT